MASSPDDSNTTDVALLAMSGDEAAFGQLVDKYSGMVTGVAYSILGDFERSEDAGQDAFLEAWKKRESLSDPAKFGSWVCSIARHRAIDLFRMTTRPADRAGDVDLHSPTSVQPGPDQVASSDEERTLVWNSLDSLPDTYREVMVLYYRGEQSVAKVADSLGETETNVRQRLVRGRELLKNEVENIVERTLRGTAPKAVFTAAVLGCLPGNAMAAAAGMAATGSQAASAGTAGKAAAAGLGSAISGAAIGTLGGLAGGALGTYMSYRSSPYQRQKQLIIRMSIGMLVLFVAFGIGISLLVAKQRSEHPFDSTTYAVVLLTTIFGFQLLLLVICGLTTWKYKRLGALAEAAGEPVDARIEERMRTHSQAVSWTSPRSMLGRPLIDVQKGPRDADGFPKTPHVARGWIAIGDHAFGRLIAIGGRAFGPVAVGGFCCGGLTLGGFGIGLLNLCGCSFGLIGTGGLAVAWLAASGIAIGWNAIGGLAIGVNAHGGAAFGWSLADGGLASSFGHARGGHVLSGQTGDAAASVIQSHWLFGLVDNGLPSVWYQVGAIAAAILFVFVVLGSVFAARIGMTTPDEDKEALRRNDAGAIFGSLLGVSAWTAGLAANEGRWDVSAVPIAVYCLAVVITAVAYFHYRKQNREIIAYAIGLGLAQVIGVASLLAARHAGGITVSHSLSIWTLIVIFEIMLMGVALTAIFIRGSLIESTQGVLK